MAEGTSWQKQNQKSHDSQTNTFVTRTFIQNHHLLHVCDGVEMMLVNRRSEIQDADHQL